MRRKLTHAKQVEAIAKVNPNIEILGEIKGNKDKVPCRCKVCGYEWTPIPKTLKRGSGCPKCANSIRGKSQKLPHEEHIAAIAKVNPDIEVLGEIINNTTKVLCRCKVCDHKWSATPNNLKSGHGCPKCKYFKIAQKLTLSHEEHVADIAKINPDIEVLGKITGSNNKVLCRCKICDHKWSPIISDLKRGHGCPKCATLRTTQKLALSHEEHLKDIYKVNPDIEVLGEIKNNRTKVLCRCKICGYKWFPIPNNLKRKRNCPKCVGLARLSHEEQIAAIAKVNPNVEIFGEIKNNRTKVLCRCKICDHKWMITPNRLKSGGGCPKCAKYGFLSHDYGKLYIMVDDPEVPTVMKVGVSVKENERRNEVLKSAHKAGVRLPDLHIVKTWEGPTDYIYEVESMVHDAFSDYRINFPVKFNGSNEFFHYRPDVFYVAQDAWLAIVANAAA